MIVVSPDDTGIVQARAKTDRLDARTLATLLSRGELESVWMPDERCRVMRRRLARREQLVRSRSRAKNEIHAVLQGRPPCSDLFGVKGRRWLADLELPQEERESVDAGIRHIEFLDGEIAAVERLIAQQALAWPEIRRLMTIPGVNLVCAASLMAAIGSADRFLTSRRLVAYLGLDPKVRQSGEAPARSAGSQSAVPRRRGGRWSRPPGASSCSPARCTRSTTAPARGAVMARRLSRPRASSRRCAGACSPATRTTPTSNPH